MRKVFSEVACTLRVLISYASAAAIVVGLSAFGCDHAAQALGSSKAPCDGTVEKAAQTDLLRSRADRATLGRIAKAVGPTATRFLKWTYVPASSTECRFLVFSTYRKSLYQSDGIRFRIINAACNGFYEPKDRVWGSWPNCYNKAKELD